MSKQTKPIFNDTYEVVKSIGEGNSSKVYLAREIKDHSRFVAIKVLKEEFLRKDPSAILSVQNEIVILKSLKHPGLINLIDYGDQGCVKKPSGQVIENLVFIVMEYVGNGLLFDTCQTLGIAGEQKARFFMK